MLLPPAFVADPDFVPWPYAKGFRNGPGRTVRTHASLTALRHKHGSHAGHERPFLKAIAAADPAGDEGTDARKHGDIDAANPQERSSRLFELPLTVLVFARDDPWPCAAGARLHGTMVTVEPAKAGPAEEGESSGPCPSEDVDCQCAKCPPGVTCIPSVDPQLTVEL